MFRLIEPSSGQIQSTVLVHSLSAHYGVTYYLQNYIDITDHVFFPINRYIYIKCKKFQCLKIYIKTPITMSLLKYARSHIY
jgi:hypothetical protein